LRVGIVVNEFNIRGGTHKQVQRLAEHLQACGDNALVLTKYFDPDRCYPGVERLAVTCGTGRREPPAWKFGAGVVEFLASVKLAWIAARRCDVVTFHDNHVKLVWLLVRLFNPGLGATWQINDLPQAFRVGPSSGRRPGPTTRVRDAVRRWATRRMGRGVDLVTVNVGKNAQRVLEHLGVEAVVHHCGVDLRNPELPGGRRPPQGVLRLVSTGVFFEYRNYEAILRAQQALRERHGIESRLTLIGSTRLSPAYAQRVVELAATLRVPCEILGEVDDERLVRAYGESDVFLFLNVDQSWGLAVFEAMNFGLPVIVSSSVGARELLHPGVDAEVLDPAATAEIADALQRLFADPALYRARSAAAFQATQGMTWAALYCEPVTAELRSLT